MEKHGERDFDREWPKVKVSIVLPLGYNVAITKVMRYIIIWKHWCQGFTVLII